MADLNPQAQAWVDALLYGNYEQGAACLRDGNKFCCLGVAADVVWPGNWAPPVDSADPAAIFRFPGEEDETDVLPDSLWAKLLEGVPKERRVNQSMVAEANDHGASFKEIVEQYILPMWEDQPLEELVDAAY